MEVYKAWGFKYKTVAFTWVKLTRLLNYLFGGGYWTRANPEICILCTIGKPSRLSAKVRNLMIAVRPPKHSQKPDETYKRVKELVAGPYVEIFPRQIWPEFSAIGNEIDGLDIRDSIALLLDDPEYFKLVTNTTNKNKIGWANFDLVENLIIESEAA
jgi:N6-adenosine-specific RNA methylase IME4